jgi:DNA-binding HxlR family transcriptional regulator
MAKPYGLDCPVARTLDVIGDRWTILILRDLFLHRTRRFQDFSEALPGLTPSVLSGRIKELEERGVIESRPYSDHPPRAEYLLTARGRTLGPVLRALRQWGEAQTTAE